MAGNTFGDRVYTGKNCQIPKLEKHQENLGKHWKIVGNSTGKPILEKEIHFPTLESHFIVFQGWQSIFNQPRLVNVKKFNIGKNISKVGTCNMKVQHWKQHFQDW